MPVDISQRIQQAIDAGEEMRIIYYGGSQPGSVRNIFPIMLMGNKLRARCMASGKAKTFAIDRIELPKDSLSASVPTWKNGLKFHQFTTIAGVFDATCDTLEGMGWYVEHDVESIALHRYFKNGKARKAIDVSITYEEFTYGYVLGKDGEWHKTVKQMRPRPWMVFAAPKHHSSFGELDTAAQRFMEWAAKLAPVYSD